MVARGNGARAGGRGDGTDDPVGRVGEVVVATRGAAGPGEVRLAIRGGTELFLAYSGDPIPRGAQVLVVHSRGFRAVDVEPWDDRLSVAASS